VKNVEFVKATPDIVQMDGEDSEKTANDGLSIVASL
jgi:hypothetical protein